MADLEIFSSRNCYHSCWLNGLKIARSSSYLSQACPLCGYQTNYGTPALDLSALAYSMVLGYICTGCIIAIYPLPSTFPARRLTIDGSCLGLRQDLVWHAIRLLRAFGGCRNEAAHEQGLCLVMVIEPQFCFWKYWNELLSGKNYSSILAGPMMDRSSLPHESKSMRTSIRDHLLSYSFRTGGLHTCWLPWS